MKKPDMDYYFVHMTDPSRYKKIKVTRACNYCRKKKTKCDIGVPGSGTCSNCEKSNTTCLFSPTSAKSISNDHVIRRQIQKSLETKKKPNNSNEQLLTENKVGHYDLCYDHQSLTSNESLPELEPSRVESQSSESIIFEPYETYENLSPSNQEPLASYSGELQEELLNAYFEHVHFNFPILSKKCVLEGSQHSSLGLMPSLKYAIMAIGLLYSGIYQDDIGTKHEMARHLYHNAVAQLDNIPSLATLHVLFLLYKFQELMTPQDSLISDDAIHYLKKIQWTLSQLPENSDDRCKASWLLYVVIVMYSGAKDSRWDELRHQPPRQLPSFDHQSPDADVSYNLLHLIHLSLSYSPNFLKASSWWDNENSCQKDFYCS